MVEMEVEDTERSVLVGWKHAIGEIKFPQGTERALVAATVS